MSDFQESLIMNGENTNHNVSKVKVVCLGTEEDLENCSVCIEGKGIQKKQIDFLKKDEESSCERVAVLKINNSDDLGNLKLKILKNGEEIKESNLDIKNANVDEDGFIRIVEDLENEKDLLVRMHYIREDGNYDGWNDVHYWLNGGIFDKELVEDSNWRTAQFGIKKVKYTDRMEFLIRKGGDNWDEKEGEERYLNLRRHEKDGVVDLYVVSGKKGILFEPPAIIDFHYHRYSSSFAGWDIWVWIQYKGKGCGEGFPVKFHKELDNFGACARYVCSDLNDIEKIGFLIRKSNGKNWEEIDMEWNRYIEVEQLEKIMRDRVANIYLAEKNLDIGYNVDDIDLSNKIVDAKFKYPEEGEGFRSVYVELNAWMDIREVTAATKNGVGFRLISEDGDEIPIEDIQGTGEIRKNSQENSDQARFFRINLGKSITPIDKMYSVSLDNFGQLPVSIRTLYEHEEFKKKCIYKFGVDYTEKKITNAYTEKSAVFRVFAPMVEESKIEELKLCLYNDAVGGEPVEEYEFEAVDDGIWYLKINEDMNINSKNDKPLKEKFYTYKAKIGNDIIESIDSYATVSSKNRERGVINLEEIGKEKISLTPKFNARVFPVAGELGVKYTKESSEFRRWAPSVDDLELCLYNEDIGGEPIARYKLKKSYGGTWYLKINEDLKGKFYKYKVRVGIQEIEVIDPYAKAAGVNGERGAIIDFSETNPKGWNETPRPKFDKNLLPIIHELNVRDYTIDKSSGVEEKYRGKFKGLTIRGTKTRGGVSTCLDHILDMGYTHVQVMPVTDFGSVDESIKDAPGSYWGYDVMHWFVLEGSFSTNPHDPKVRIEEFKEMIQTFHENGVGVILDVVFNHTYRTQFSPFNVFSPDYFYRIKNNGEYSKATGCSNEIASEKEMVRKCIIDSITYWVKEFKVDGFRFDVMYLLDIDTMNAIRKAIDEIDPDVKMIDAKDSSKVWVYGEGWKPPIEPIVSIRILSIKDNLDKLNDIAFFDNDLGDAMKGDFNNADGGYATQRIESKGKLESCIEVDKDRADRVINYVGVHDNLTWWDKIRKSFKDVLDEVVLYTIRKFIYLLGYLIVFTRPGLVLVPEGDEFLRSKNEDKNSYAAGDKVNAINWDEKEKNLKVVNYIKGLIKMKKAYGVFNGKAKLQFIGGLLNGVVGFLLEREEEKAVVLYNGGWEKSEISIPKEFGEEWAIIANSEKAGAEEITTVEKGSNESLKVRNNKVVVLAHSGKALVDKKSLRRYMERKKKCGAKDFRDSASKNIKIGNEVEIKKDVVKIGNKIKVIPQECARQSGFCVNI